MLFYVVFQRVRVGAVSVLGQFRHGGSRHFRPEWHQDLHPVLGSTVVRLLQRHQRHRPAQPSHCHDVQLLRHDNGNQSLVLMIENYSNSMILRERIKKHRNNSETIIVS